MDEAEKNLGSLKKLYLLVRRFDLSVGQKPPVTLREVCIPDNCSSDIMLQYIRKQLGLMDKDIVFKLRNHRGSLVIPKGSIEANSVNTPYSVDIAQVHQTMIPKDRSISFSEPEDTTKEMLKSFITRIERMEEQLPDLSARRSYRIEREIQDIDRQLYFLKKRLEEADKVEWQGTVKNNPVW